MAAILNHLKAARCRRGHEIGAPDQPLDIADLALHNAAAPRLGRVQELCQPLLGSQVVGKRGQGGRLT